jgi:hypothetical protein
MMILISKERRILHFIYHDQKLMTCDDAKTDRLTVDGYGTELIARPSGGALMVGIGHASESGNIFGYEFMTVLEEWKKRAEEQGKV